MHLKSHSHTLALSLLDLSIASATKVNWSSVVIIFSFRRIYTRLNLCGLFIVASKECYRAEDIVVFGEIHYF